MRELLDKCANAINRNDNTDAVIKLKLLNIYENDLNVIIKKLYSRVNFNQILKFANDIENMNISTTVYQQIYIETHKSDDQKKISLLQGVKAFINIIGRDSVLNENIHNIYNTLIEPWKDTIKIQVYEFIEKYTFKKRNLWELFQNGDRYVTEERNMNNMELIYEITQLDGKLLCKAFDDVFNEIINCQGPFDAIKNNENYAHEIYSTYFNAIEIILRYLNNRIEYSTDIINFGYHIKNQLELLPEPPYFYQDKVELLENAFPLTVRNIIFSEFICIKNKNGKYIKSSDIIIDGYKKLVTLNENESTVWKLIRHNSTSFKIISKDGTLFADDDYYGFGRFIYTSNNLNKTNSDADLWEMNYNTRGDYIDIKNKLFSEYLNVGHNDVLLSSIYSNLQWIIEDCQQDRILFHV